VGQRERSLRQRLKETLGELKMWRPKQVRIREREILHVIS
jgi:hypothetical protein